MIKVAEWGTGMMGQGLLGYILDRPKDIDLCGDIVTNPAKEGKTVGELLGRPFRSVAKTFQVRVWRDLVAEFGALDAASRARLEVAIGGAIGLA